MTGARVASRDGWTFVLADSLEKVFADECPRAMDRTIPIVAFAEETVSFQVAFLPPTVVECAGLGRIRFETSAPTGVEVRVSSVELVPCAVPALEQHDEGYLRDTAGLYPDLLRPLGPAPLMPYVGQWRAVWVDVVVPADAVGTFSVGIRAVSVADGTELFADGVAVEATGVQLPALDIVNTHWLHGDAIAQYYGVEVFGEEYWAILERFVASAARMRANTILTPVWTPPLDTEIGGSRLPVQLVRILETAEGLTFDFARLERWIALCRRHGMTRLEIPHLFTQWGANCAPVFLVETAVGVESRFGWDVAATDPAYVGFLEQFLPQLLRFLDERWGLAHVVFHVSDEPHGPQMRDSYAAARAVVVELLDGCLVADALSDFEFYESGLVPQPIVATDAVEPFLRAGVEKLWVYYCVAQARDVANRFIAMPSYRNRVLGSQLFAIGAGGFLHWGFNFYNTALSRAPIDPFTDTCAGGEFLAGDAFAVYPGSGGVPWESIRYRVFVEAMDDHRALQLLRSLVGRDAAMDVLDPERSLSTTRYSCDPDDYRRTRVNIIRAIVRVSAEGPSAG